MWKHPIESLNLVLRVDWNNLNFHETSREPEVRRRGRSLVSSEYSRSNRLSWDSFPFCRTTSPRIGRNNGIEIRTRLARVLGQSALKLPGRTTSYRPITTIISFPFIGNFVIDECWRNNSEKLIPFISLSLLLIFELAIFNVYLNMYATYKWS